MAEGKPERKRVVPAGRVLLAVGGALLLIGLFLPWFDLGGNAAQLPAGAYTGVTTTTLLNDLAKGPYAWIAFAWLLVCAIVAFAAAALGRKVANFGVSGVLVLVLYAILLFVAQNLVNQQTASASAAVSFTYGFIVAILGSAFIEAGMRMSVRPPAPAGTGPVAVPPERAAAPVEPASKPAEEPAEGPTP